LYLVVKRAEIEKNMVRQIKSFFEMPKSERTALGLAIEIAISRMEILMNATSEDLKYSHINGIPAFNSLNTDQYAMFLYIVSNTCYKNFEEANLASKVYYLNKIMHGIDVYYEVMLPEIFKFGHCVGTVLGRAKYGNYFGVMHNCTVGNNLGKYPTFEDRVGMLVGSKVLGDSYIGRNTIISANTTIIDENIPENSIVFGSSPNLVIKSNNITMYREKFK
jgi:serine O-acetyltransferase